MKIKLCGLSGLMSHALPWFPSHEALLLLGGRRVTEPLQNLHLIMK